MRITVVDVPALASFELRIDDELVGRASYHVTDNAKTLPHTEIDPSRHGRGLGTILVRGVLVLLPEYEDESLAVSGVALMELVGRSLCALSL
jgi:hypothetical protein